LPNREEALLNPSRPIESSVLFIEFA